MTVKTKNEPKAILLDADVIIHFSFGDSLLSIKNIFPKYEKWVIDIVEGEINKRHSSAYTQLNLMFNMGVFKRVEFPSIGTPTYMEYVSMRKTIQE